MGLAYIRHLAKPETSRTLRVKMTLPDGTVGYSYYDKIQLQNSLKYYKLTLGNYLGNPYSIDVAH